MLAINLPQHIENRLFLLSQTIGVSQDVLAQNAIHQYLENLELVYQLNKQRISAEQTPQKHTKSRAGALARYANPALIEQEKSAWGEAMLDKHGLQHHE